jgi:hypothetical protein
MYKLLIYYPNQSQSDQAYCYAVRENALRAGKASHDEAPDTRVIVQDGQDTIIAEHGPRLNY